MSIKLGSAQTQAVGAGTVVSTLLLTVTNFIIESVFTQCLFIQGPGAGDNSNFVLIDGLGNILYFHSAVTPAAGLVVFQPPDLSGGIINALGKTSLTARLTNGATVTNCSFVYNVYGSPL